MTEHDEQSALFQWADTKQTAYPALALMFAIPNGTRTTPGVAKRMKAEGVKKGIPDICLPVARGDYHGMFIEMKMPGKYPRPEQREWINNLMEQGYCAIWCWGWERASEMIIDYLEGKLVCVKLEGRRKVNAR